ncbi:alpha-ketoglutarate-dependent dioxygenase alkB homolog 4 [Neocloeon triangulifer]|uniref:alpha-ketoglutarate-dependent dioxygenase alkB homolog 4 n=1 Tax=Neocloeon triangulifer TaxID=2078957 RepID=UPI00286FA524|nr:alpha-ketoglutarate-dependent dioxygenase alkB homolog 4 [Neocloeon triangulifer]
MAKPRPCGCKGIRTCLICEVEFGAANLQKEDDFETAIKEGNSFVYCPKCPGKAWSGWDENQVVQEHPNHLGESVDFPGIYIHEDFLTKEEAEILVRGIDDTPWDLSQSGRRKQNFGPKCNFKRQKIAVGSFGGFPAFSLFVQEKFKKVPVMDEFQSIEQCTLEYNPDRGASIDPHIDDCWIWGERIVTVNVLGDSVLTMTYLQEKDRCRYNLPLAPDLYLNFDESLVRKVVRIPMSVRSLLIMTGQARYQWEHRILREDVKELRICLAYREFTPPYLKGGDKFGPLINKIYELASCGRV